MYTTVNIYCHIVGLLLIASTYIFFVISSNDAAEGQPAEGFLKVLWHLLAGY